MQDSAETNSPRQVSRSACSVAVWLLLLVTLAIAWSVQGGQMYEWFAAWRMQRVAVATARFPGFAPARLSRKQA